MIKILLLSNVPSPYLSPVYQLLKNNKAWELVICYVSDWNQGVGWTADSAHQYLAETDIVLARRKARIASMLGTQLLAAIVLLVRLIKLRPDCLLSYGYTQLPQLLLIWWASLTGVPIAIAGDANYYTDNVTGWRRLLKRRWLRYVVKRAKALVVVGTAGRLFWESYGAQSHQLFHAGFAVDNDYFQRESVIAQNDALRLREKFGWRQATVFLYVGRLIKRKNIHLLIAALKRSNKGSIALLVAGDGCERTALEALALADTRIRFVGALTQQQLPLYYALADVLVLPAETEPWGLVINEAMASGLAIIAHQYCGATIDLVARDNGVVLRGYEIDEIAKAMMFLATDNVKLEMLKRNSLVKIQSWTMSECASSLRKIIETMCNLPECHDLSSSMVCFERSDAK